MSIYSITDVVGCNVKEVSDVPQQRSGTKARTDDGRIMIYGKASVDLVKSDNVLFKLPDSNPDTNEGFFVKAGGTDTATVKLYNDIKSGSYGWGTLIKFTNP